MIALRIIVKNNIGFVNFLIILANWKISTSCERGSIISKGKILHFCLSGSLHESLLKMLSVESLSLNIKPILLKVSHKLFR